MTMAIQLVGGGAVTPVGLDRAQTCAGIRARMARFENVLRKEPFGASQPVARIPAHWSLRRTPIDWLVNLAARAVREVIDRHVLDPAATALLLIPPESFRSEAFDDEDLPASALGALASRVAAKLGLPFAVTAQTPDGGAAALVTGLDHALRLLNAREVTHVLLAAADCYVLDSEFRRLDGARRLRTPRTAQGLTPGEGAACALLAVPGTPRRASPSLQAYTEPTALLLGWAGAQESHCATSNDYSQGRALVDAMRTAAQHAHTDEAALGWTLSNANGERYAAWEATLAHARWYRSRRERLVTVQPAMSVGEAGAASGPLALLAAAHRFTNLGRGTTRAMVELASEAGGRAACVVAPLGVPS